MIMLLKLSLEFEAAERFWRTYSGKVNTMMIIIILRLNEFPNKKLGLLTILRLAPMKDIMMMKGGLKWRLVVQIKPLSNEIGPYSVYK